MLFDLGGSAPGSCDTLSVGGNARFAGSASSTLRLRLAPGFAPALDTTFPLATYASVLVQPGEPIFDLVDSNYALDLATRFTPTIQLLAQGLGDGSTTKSRLPNSFLVDSASASRSTGPTIY